MSEVLHCSQMVRRTAKIVASDSEGRILLLETPDGIINIPGGGIDKGESPRAALRRELTEELPGFLFKIGHDSPREVDGVVKMGRRALWSVFVGSVDVPASSTPREPGQIPDENEAFYLLSPEEALRFAAQNDRGINDLTYRALTAVFEGR